MVSGRETNEESSVSLSGDTLTDVRSAAEETSNKLNTKSHLVDNLEDIPNEMARQAIANKEAVAYYDTKTGEVYVYMPYMKDANATKRTIQHDVLGHKGMRELIGADKYDAAMIDIYEMLSKCVLPTWMISSLSLSKIIRKRLCF